MKSTQAIQSDYHQFHVSGGDLQQKLNSTAENGCCKFGLPICKTFMGQTRMLLSFHLLNVLIAVDGLILVAVFLTATVMNSCFIVCYVSVAVILSPFVLVAFVPDRLVCLQKIGYVVACAMALVLWYVSCLNLYTLLGPWVCLVVGGVGWCIFHLSLLAMKTLAEADVRLINFISSAVSISPQDLQRGKYAAKLNTNNNFNDVALPFLNMTYRGWMTVFYFGIMKVFVGLLSAAIVVCAVVQPLIALCSGGSFPFLVFWVTFHENPVIYVGGIALLWVIASAGCVLVAKLSIKMTLCVFSDEDTSNEPGSSQQTTERDIEATV